MPFPRALTQSEKQTYIWSKTMQIYMYIYVYLKWNNATLYIYMCVCVMHACARTFHRSITPIVAVPETLASVIVVIVVRVEAAAVTVVVLFNSSREIIAGSDLVLQWNYCWPDHASKVFNKLVNINSDFNLPPSQNMWSTCCVSAPQKKKMEKEDFVYFL